MTRRSPRSTKRVLVASDLHCGHVIGLTPPDWHERPPAPPGKGRKRRRGRTRFSQVQRDLWQFYVDTVEALKPIDVLLCNGDAVEGKGPRSGGTELITTDRNEQADMAAECIDVVGAKNIVMTYGTPYHTGCSEDWEDVVADRVGAAKIGGHEWVDVNGVVFDLKHHCTSSSVPHGRHTAAAREHLWNILWAEHDESPKSDVIIRSHVHYFDYCGGYGWLAMTTPALQGKGSKYGVRRCSGTVDFGLTHFDVDAGGRFSWEAHIIKVTSQRAKALRL